MWTAKEVIDVPCWDENLVSRGTSQPLEGIGGAKFPKWELLENKSGKSGVFFEGEKSASSHHVKTTIHHVLTIKKPRSVHPFFENPPQKRIKPH
jgi:hypothetical protein